MSVCLDDEADLANHDLHGTIGTMTMPDITDDAPRLSELVRIMQDFRAEFRHAMETVVRKDVYAAERAAAELQIVSLRQEMMRMEAAQKAELVRLDREITTHHIDHKSQRNQMMFSWITAGLSLLVGLVLAVVK